MRSVALCLALLASGCFFYSSSDDEAPPDAGWDPGPYDATPVPDAAVIPDAAVPDADLGADANWTALTPVEEVAFTPPERSALTREVTLFTSAADFTTRFGVAPPGDIDFGSEWALFYSEGARPHPGNLVSVLSIESDGGDGLRATTRHRSPGSGCVTLDYSPPATVLVTFPAQSGTPTLQERPVVASFDCTANGATADATCDHENLCGPDLICSGLTRFTSGWCRPTWMWEVTSETLDMPIPDDDAGGLVRTAAVSGLATVDEDVIVRVELDHPDPSELVITITNPSSNEVTVWNGETAPGGSLVIHRVPIGFSGDESVNGTWILKVVDGAAGNAGRLLGWTLEVTSRFD